MGAPVNERTIASGIGIVFDRSFIRSAARCAGEAWHGGSGPQASGPQYSLAVAGVLVCCIVLASFHPCRDNRSSPESGGSLSQWPQPTVPSWLFMLELSDCVIWTNPCMYMYMCMYICKRLYNIYGLSDRWDASHQLSLSPGPWLVSAPSRYQLLPYSSILHCPHALQVKNVTDLCPL